MKKQTHQAGRFLSRPEPDAWVVDKHPIVFTLTANAGVLIDYDRARLLVDGLHSGVESFSGVPENMVEAIVTGQPPFSGIGWLLYTHLHADHFSAKATERFLARNPGAKLVFPANKMELDASQELADFCALLKNDGIVFWNLDVQPGRFAEIPIEPDIRLRAFPAKHGGEVYRTVSHYCFLFTFGTRNVLFLGDADYDKDFFAEMLEGIQVHAAVVNPLHVSAPAGRRTLLEGIHPQRLIVNHIPFHGEDPLRLRQLVSRCLERYRQSLPPTVVLWEAMDRISM